MKALILATGLLFTGAALAAGTATYRVDDMSMSYSWRGDSVRMESDVGQGYMLWQDDEVYMVSQGEDGPTVMAMSSLMRAAGDASANSGAFSGIKAESVSLDPTGRSETIAGLTGEVYEITTVHGDGSRSTGEVVLSDDPRLVELTHTLFSMNASISDQPDAMAEEFLGRDQGWLRYDDGEGTSMVLTAISGDTPPARLFELPAKPMQFPAGAGGADTSRSANADNQDSGGGLFGGLFGGADDKVEAKAERQQQRQTSKVEQRVDEETDNVVDKAVDGLMDSLFGG